MTPDEQQPVFELPTILRTLNQHIKLIIAAPLICAIVSYILVSFVLAPKWEASAILQVGQIGSIGRVGLVPEQPAKLVEPISNVVARMQTPSFSSGFIDSSTIKQEDRAAAKAIYDSTVKVAQLKGVDFIELKVRGYSSDMARSLLLDSITHLQDIHNEMMEPSLSRIKSQIKTIETELQVEKTDFEFLKKQLHANHDWNSYNATLAATVLQDKSHQIQESTEKYLLLTEQINPKATFTTKVIDDIYVPNEPVSPKKVFIVFMSVLMGLLGSIFFILARVVLPSNQAKS